jgi:Rrf2 family protein
VRLQKNSALALCSVIEFALNPGRQVSAAEIAGKYRVSAHHLAKVLSELARGGIVESVRGAGGGYRFVANARRLTLLDVIERFERMTPAPNQDPGARTPAGAALRTVLGEIDAMARATLSSITLATMVRIIERQQAPAARPGGAARSDAAPFVARTRSRRSSSR